MLSLDCNESYVYKKDVEWSMLHEGVNIPVTIQMIFQNKRDRFLQRGQSKDIFLILEGKTYQAKLINQRFDENKYPNRKDILQIRYKPQSEIASKLRSVFSASYEYLFEQRSNSYEGSRKLIKVPEGCVLSSGVKYFSTK